MQVIRNAKLWCDVESAKEAEYLSNEWEYSLVPGFTASKILWLKNNEPENFARLRTVLLPHDFLNYMQTGDCKFHDYCQTGLSNGFCMYAAEWASYIRDEPLGQQVSSACLVYHTANVGNQHLAERVQGRLQEPSLNEEIMTTLQDLGLNVL